MRRSAFALAISIFCAAALSGNADAGLWQGVWQGLDLLATPSGSPIISNGAGFRVNGARSGRVRVVPAGVAGDGYRLEFDRNFGTDASGRPETFRFGIGGEMTLNGSTSMTAQYDKIGDRDWTLSGSLGSTITDLNYTFRTKTGAQDVQLTGTLDATTQINVNPLGFYEGFISTSNTNSNLQIDGVLVRDDEALNFDVGPIAVRGNIFVDGLSALLTTFGIDTAALEELFPESPMNLINDAIRSELQAAAAGTPADAEVAPLLLSSVLGQDAEAAAALVDVLVTDDALPEAAIVGPQPATTEDGQAAVPEPGTLMLVACGAVLTLRRMRRRA